MFKIKIYRGIFVLVLYGREDGLSQPRTIIHSVCEVHLGRRKGELQTDKTVLPRIICTPHTLHAIRKTQSRIRWVKHTARKCIQTFVPKIQRIQP